MPTSVRIYPVFRRELKNLRRKYPSVQAEVRKLSAQLRQGERPGNKIPGTGRDVFKVRLPNPSARRGKSGGFRVIYYLKLADVVYLLVIYSKTEADDISIAEIRQRVAAVLQENGEM